MFKIEGSTFYEKINLVKLKYIIKNPEKYKDVIEKEKRHKDDEKQVPIWTLIKNISKKLFLFLIHNMDIFLSLTKKVPILIILVDGMLIKVWV